jgi:2-polyprenyl-3-methyl-5-hydroxy-6-metoxy-1,4-benzoquinol methylase
MKSILSKNSEAIFIKSINPKEIVKKWINNLEIELGDEFKNLNSIDYFQCPDTGFCWYEPKEAAGTSNLYEQLEKFDWYYMEEKWEFTMALNLINQQSKILEVGAGGGHFLRRAVKKNHFVHGTELNQKRTVKMRSLGFEIKELTMNQLKEKTNEQYDVICAFQVLEHVSNPLEFISDMISLLNTGGKIILSVPNAEVMKKIDPYNEDLLNQPPHHMGHWDKNVFYALEKLLPFKVKSFHYEPLASYHISWVTTQYLRNKILFLGKTFSRLLVNHYTTLPLQFFLHLGIKKYIRGHTLLVELETI